MSIKTTARKNSTHFNVLGELTHIFTLKTAASMEASTQTVVMMRNEAKANIKAYLTAHPAEAVTEGKIWQDLSDMADRYNVQLPTEYYRRMYNLSLELKDNKPLTTYPS